jgi:hypothetical protein
MVADMLAALDRSVDDDIPNARRLVRSRATGVLCGLTGIRRLSLKG